MYHKAVNIFWFVVWFLRERLIGSLEKSGNNFALHVKVIQ